MAATAHAPRLIGEPPVSVELTPGTLPADRRGPVAAYLHDAGAVIAAPGTTPDPLTPDGSSQIPVAVRTDGVWVWDSVWEVLAGTHGVAPPAEFLAHMAGRDYVPEQLGVDELMAVARRVGLAPPE